MKTITDNVTITELSRLTNKSRPTIYKWITLYENESKEELPQVIAQLFDMIAENASKKDIYQFCEDQFVARNEDEDLEEILQLLRKYRGKLNLERIRNFILEEMRNE
ncbi:MAG: hypothetical protein K2M75_06725 [Clostridia bacterium]|nr:hypothetical protein [Clostridia bacterium]